MDSYRRIALVVLLIAAPLLAHAEASCSSLFLGSSGPEVVALQQFLANTYSNFPTSTGYFGPITQEAVQQWQAEHHIVSSGSAAMTGWGVVGPKTRLAMELSCALTPPSAGSVSAAQLSAKQSLLQSLLAQLKVLQSKLSILMLSKSASTTGSAGGGERGVESTIQTPTPMPPPALPTSMSSCTFNGQTLASGASVTTYQANSVPSGQRCVSQERACTNGTLSGSYLYASCVVSATPIDVFIIAGQSNAQGLPPKPALVTDCSIQSTIVPLAGTAYYYDPPTATIKQIGQINCGGAWPAFATTYEQQTNHPIVFVQTAVGSTSLLPIADSGFGNWNPGTFNGLYSNSTEVTNAALTALEKQGYAPTIKGILWDEGESEISAMESDKLTGSQYTSEYPAALQNLFAHFKSDLGQNVEFFLFRTGLAAPGDDALFKLARDTEESTAASTPGMYVVFRKSVRFFSLGEMYLQGNGAVHYAQTGYDEMGTIGAQDVLDALSGREIPSTDETTLPDTLCTMTATSSAQGMTLSWWAVNASTGSISNSIGNVIPAGTLKVNPSQTTTYTATFQSSESVPSGSCNATAVVSGQVPTVHIDVNGQHPTYVAPAGSNGYTLDWSSMNASSCSLSQSNGTTYQTWPLNGSGQSGLFLGTDTFTCSNSAGSASDSITISQ